MGSSMRNPPLLIFLAVDDTLKMGTKFWVVEVVMAKVFVNVACCGRLKEEKNEDAAAVVGTRRRRKPEIFVLSSFTSTTRRLRSSLGSKLLYTTMEQVSMQPL